MATKEANARYNPLNNPRNNRISAEVIREWGDPYDGRFTHEERLVLRAEARERLALDTTRMRKHRRRPIRTGHSVVHVSEHDMDIDTERRLEHDFLDYCEIDPEDNWRSWGALACDIYSERDHEIVEVKVRPTAASFHTAVGELLHYVLQEGMWGATMTILTSDEPSQDLKDYADSYGIGCCWRDGAGRFTE